MNGIDFTESSDFAPLPAPPPTDFIAGPLNTIELLLIDPEGFSGDTHGTRILASLRTQDPDNTVNVATASAGTLYYDVTGTDSGGINDEITITTDGSAIIEHYIRLSGELGIIARSYDNSPSLWQATLGQWEIVNGDYYNKEAKVMGELIAAGNSLHVTSMENLTVNNNGDVIPAICENNPALSSTANIPSEFQDNDNQLLAYIPPCGAIDHYVAEQDIGMDKTIFVGVAEYSAFTTDGIAANSIILVDMQNYFNEDENNRRQTTSHATPIIAAKAAQIAELEGIDDAVTLKSRLMDFVDPVTRHFDFDAINQVLGFF